MREYYIRRLLIDDLLKYKLIRLELLKMEPMNFGSSFEEESTFSDKMWIDRLTKTHIRPLGAFMDDELVGVVLVVMNPRMKMKHVATINSMYVKDKYRGNGIGNALIEKAFLMAKEENVEILNLSVVSTNLSAYHLYQKHGFIEYGKEEKAIKYDSQYYHLILMSKKM